MRPSSYTDALPDDEYRDFLRSCGHTAARIERRDFLDDEEPDLDLFAEPESYQRKPEKSPDRSPAEAPDEPIARRRAMDSPPPPEPEPTLLEQTLAKLKRTSVAKTLVKYVDEQANRRTTLEPLVRYLNKGRAPTPWMMEKTKQQVRRTAAMLDERTAPLRLEWDWNQDYIELNERPAQVPVHGSMVTSVQHDIDPRA
jgi:hypothetical protein